MGAENSVVASLTDTVDALCSKLEDTEQKLRASNIRYATKSNEWRKKNHHLWLIRRQLEWNLAVQAEEIRRLKKQLRKQKGDVCLNDHLICELPNHHTAKAMKFHDLRLQRWKLQITLAQRDEEIKRLQNQSQAKMTNNNRQGSDKEDSISEISELRVNLYKLQAQFQETAQNLSNSKAILVRKDDELKYMTKQLIDSHYTSAQKVRKLEAALARKEKKIEGLQNQLETNVGNINECENENERLKSEVSELKVNLDELQAQLQRTADDLRNSMVNFDELQSKHRSLELDLAKKEDALKHMKDQLKIQTDEVQLQKKQVSDETSKRTTWEHANQLLQTELVSLRSNLSSVQAQLELSIKQVQDETEKRIQKSSEWNTKCQLLQNKCSAYKKELNSYKSGPKVTTCQMCQQLIKLAGRIEEIRGYLVSSISDSRTSCYDKIEKITAAYQRKTFDLERRKLMMPNTNFAVSLSKYRSVYEENTGKLQDSLKGVDQVKEESISLFTMKNIGASDAIVKVVNKYLSQLGQLQWSSFDRLDDERKLYEDVKKAYQEANIFFKSVQNN